jgi:hypothetical protein
MHLSDGPTSARGYQPATSVYPFAVSQALTKYSLGYISTSFQAWQSAPCGTSNDTVLQTERCPASSGHKCTITAEHGKMCLPRHELKGCCNIQRAVLRQLATTAVIACQIDCTVLCSTILTTTFAQQTLALHYPSQDTTNHTCRCVKQIHTVQADTQYRVGDQPGY